VAPSSTTDTIVAIATPPGRGALGIVRLSGPHAARIAAAMAGRTAPLVPRQATLARAKPSGEGPPDQVVITWFPAPHSYTGEESIELTAHGSIAILDGLVRAAVALGARRAGPGEFTFRAYVNGRIDLTQAEAVADLTAAVTPRQARAAFEQLEGRLGTEIRAMAERILDIVAGLEASLDFPDEGYHFGDAAEIASSIAALGREIEDLLVEAPGGCLLRDGATVVITGRPNTGKSSLFNALLRIERAIVSPSAGTTRDVIIESFNLNGVPVSLVDTAGRHETGDAVEAEGVRRAESAAARADLELLVLDRSEALTVLDEALLSGASSSRIVVLNKSDRPPAWPAERVLMDRGVLVSALTGAGLEELARRMEAALGGRAAGTDVPRLTNARHVDLLRAASSALRRAETLATSRAAEELVIFELNAALSALEDVVGVRTADDVLARIFERFCIGK
jgi:tRNA modification GTPase